jgi:hypothetical protein
MLSMKVNTEINWTSYYNNEQQSLSLVVPGARNANVRIYDLLGNLVYIGDMVNGDMKINTRTISEGVYLIYVNSNDRILVRKIQIY